MTKVRYQVFAMNFMACLINYGDRIALSVAAPFILAEFDFAPAVWGVILSAFFWTYSPFALIGGIMADRVGVRRAYTICMLVWSLTIPLTASAWNAGSFIVARLLFGAGEGPQAPISTKLTASWFPRRLTSSMLNLARSGTTVGPIIATPFVVWACTTLGWRWAFVLLGSVGVVWTVMWWIVARDGPKVHPRANEAETAYITADHVSAEESDGKRDSGRFWELLRSRYVIALSMAFFAYSWVLFMFLTWYPQYLVDARGVDKADLAGLATLPWISATIGLVGGGLVADRLIKRFGSLVTPRKWIIVGCLLATAACFAPSPFLASPTLGLVLVCVATLFLLASYQYQALVVAVAPGRHTGRLAGVIQMCSTLAGILAPIVTGAIVQVTGSYAAAFVVGGALAVAGAVMVLLWVRDGAAGAVTSGGQVTAALASE
ncbi:MAG: MFS transporter [Streptosporangiales bacterium]|nr:MFS transporter [Streptosporangiales bacterium]